MKALFVILCFQFFHITTFTQYYLRGEVRDEKNNPLPNAKIVLHSTRYVYLSGSSGAFGITSSQPRDSVTIILDGYNQHHAELNAVKYQTLYLKPLQSAAGIKKNRLLSFTKNLSLDEQARWSVGSETYSSIVENEFLPARKYPETGFAINCDKASYSNIRRFLNMNTKVPPDAVRIEEMMNYFSFDAAPPRFDSVFGFRSYVTDCPWNMNSRLLFLQVNARKLEEDKIPPSNLVFLIDVSGSMDMPNRLPLLKASFKLLVENLREQDTISIVVYGSATGVRLVPTSGKEKEKIRKAIEELTPGGATPGESGIIAAYRIAKSQFIKNGNNRVIIATDGDFNIGQTSEDDLERLIIQHQSSGIYLTCLGVGMGNYKDSKLEVLAKKGNGNFAYLDNEQEAEKVLVKELTQTLFTVADDVYLNMVFNPSLVKEYRLIGYENKLKALTDSLSEVEGGEVGSGHSMMMLTEFTPFKVNQDSEVIKEMLAGVTVHYRLPSDSASRFTGYQVPYNFTEFHELPDSYRFASSIALFALLLKDSKFTRKAKWNDAVILASQSYRRDDYIQKEFLTLIEKAKRIYGKKRKRNNN